MFLDFASISKVSHSVYENIIRYEKCDVWNTPDLKHFGQRVSSVYFVLMFSKEKMEFLILFFFYLLEWALSPGERSCQFMWIECVCSLLVCSFEEPAQCLTLLMGAQLPSYTVRNVLKGFGKPKMGMEKPSVEAEFLNSEHLSSWLAFWNFSKTERGDEIQ